MIDRKKLNIIKINYRKLEDVIESLGQLNMDINEIVDNEEDEEVIAAYETIQNIVDIAITCVSDGKYELEDVIFNEN